MKRNEFIKTCGGACFGILAFGVLPIGCGSTKIISATVEEDSLVIPITSFQTGKIPDIKFRNYVIAQNSRLAYPIYIYRENDAQYSAVLMRCSHQGTELQAFGDRLQCPAHGSDFDKKGMVTSGPAIENLRTFPIKIEGDNLKISLA